MKWFDNKLVHITANCETVDISHKVQCWDGKAKKHVMVDCPDIVKKYNSAMGGVDLADMLMSVYLTPYKTRRWYLRVIVHLLDICKSQCVAFVYATQLKIPVHRQMKLAEFTSKIANALIYRGKPSDRPVGRPKKHLSKDDVHFDKIGHWLQCVQKKGRCRVCKMKSRVKCMKCSRLHSDENGSVYLWLEIDHNCFLTTIL